MIDPLFPLELFGINGVAISIDPLEPDKLDPLRNDNEPPVSEAEFPPCNCKDPPTEFKPSPPDTVTNPPAPPPLDAPPFTTTEPPVLGEDVTPALITTSPPSRLDPDPPKRESVPPRDPSPAAKRRLPPTLLPAVAEDVPADRLTELPKLDFPTPALIEIVPAESFELSPVLIAIDPVELA